MGGLAPALLVFGHTGRLFQEKPQLLGLGLDDAADRALADDGIGARPQTRAQKHVLHITTAHRLVVDVITRGAITAEHPFDGNFSKLPPLPARAVVGVVKDQLDTRTTSRLAGGGAVEDHILHRLAAQLAGPAFTEHPAHCIHDVGFATTVGADHAHQLTRQHESGGLSEGFKTRKLDRIEAHSQT